MNSSTAQSERTGAKLERLLQNAEPGHAYLWMKGVAIPKDEKKDGPSFYSIGRGPRLASLIQNLRSRVFLKQIEFSGITPSNPSVKKWVLRIMEGYPRLNHDLIDDLLNAFREKLRSRSKEHGRFIVAALLMEKLLLLVHSRLDEALFKDGDFVRAAELVLHHRSVLRADLLSFDNEDAFLSAFEHSRSWSMGHAEFWGISETDVSWESFGNILFKIEFEKFEYHTQVYVDLDQVEQMLGEGVLTKYGEIKIGAETGIISRVEANRSGMSFSKFIDRYVLLKERIKEHEEYFHKIITPGAIHAHDTDLDDTYRYEEDLSKLYEFLADGPKAIKTKKHPRYQLCYFTGAYPRVRMRPSFISAIYRSVFEEKKRSIIHVGEPKSLDSIQIGGLQIFNEVHCSKRACQFINELIHKTRDCNSKKATFMLQSTLCGFARVHIKNEHLPEMFEFMNRELILPALRSEFENKSLLQYEGVVEFKSKDAVDAKPGRFVRNSLVPAIRKILKRKPPICHCIIYGIEDDGRIVPLSNFPNNRITDTQASANKMLAEHKIETQIHSIPVDDGSLLLVLLIPLID